MIQRFGWRRDNPDKRDVKFMAAPPVALPDTLDMRPHMPGIYNQGQSGSCTGNGIAGAIEYRRRRQGLHDFVPSRLFIYWNERVMENTTASDAGASIRDGIKAVASLGACSEDGSGPDVWPWNINNLLVEPPASCFAAAMQDIVSSYASVDQTNVDLIRTMLVRDYPIVFGFTVYGGYDNPPGGMVPMPGPIDIPLGGHCNVICGYDHPKQLFLCRNSWGKGWGLGGYCWFPYAYLTDTDLTADFWTVDTVG